MASEAQRSLENLQAPGAWGRGQDGDYTAIWQPGSWLRIRRRRPWGCESTMVSKPRGTGGGKAWRVHIQGQNPDKSLTTQISGVLTSVVVAKDTAGPAEMLWAGAERPDCSVVASPSGSAWG